MIYFTSDLHLMHDKKFIYEARGFASVAEHDSAVIANFNSRAKDDDIVYILGDLALSGSIEEYEERLSQLRGEIHFIRGNHDSAQKIELYKRLGFIDEGYAIAMKINGMNLMLSHYPMMTSNYDDQKEPKMRVFNLCGHTHGTNPYENIEHGAYNVGLDAHGCQLVSADQVTDAIRKRCLEGEL